MAEQAVVIPDAEHERKRYIGGSDISGILGISPWASPVEVYLKKTEPQKERVPTASKKRFNRGKVWEAVVGEMLTDELTDRGYKIEIVGANRRYVDPAVPFFAAEIDYEILIDGATEITNCELKTCHPNAVRYWGESDSETYPSYYGAQVAWGLGVTGRRLGVLAALFGADELRVYVIERDEDTVQGLRALASAFWNEHVLAGVPPLPGDVNDCNLLFKIARADSVMIADPDLTDKALRLRELSLAIDANEAAYATLEFQVKRAMQDCEVLRVDQDNAVTWKNRKTSRLDVAAMKETYPKIYRELTKTGESRVFTVNKGFKAR
jgi:putative phage-type endonuclease